ncbi:MAG: hypothetical protein ACK5II_08310 [Paracoccus sp. (in: a-proteobacteria)]
MIDQRGNSNAGGRAMIIGAVLTVLWLVMLLVFWITANETATGAALWVSVVAALMPLGLIWIAVYLARTIDTLKAEADALRATLDYNILRTEPPPMSSRPTPGTAGQPAGTTGAGTQKADVAIPPPPDRRAGQPAGNNPRQAHPDLEMSEQVRPTPDTIIRALNFPDGPDDQQAVQALREALLDPDHARLIRSAQDVVTLLAKRGIFTDELTPDPATPAAWRRFAEGQRGQAVTEVGTIRNPESVEMASAAMVGDDVFRDAVHHFLRLFDRSTTVLMPKLDDEQIIWLADTRSARAFMLLARAAGLFGQDD